MLDAAELDGKSSEEVSDAQETRSNLHLKSSLNYQDSISSQLLTYPLETLNQQMNKDIEIAQVPIPPEQDDSIEPESK